MFEQVKNVIVDTLSCDAEAVTMEAWWRTWRPTLWTLWS